MKCSPRVESRDRTVGDRSRNQAGLFCRSMNATAMSTPFSNATMRARATKGQIGKLIRMLLGGMGEALAGGRVQVIVASMTVSGMGIGGKILSALPLAWQVKWLWRCP